MKQKNNSSQQATKKDLHDLENRIDKKFGNNLFKHKIDVFAEMSQLEQQAKDREMEYHSEVMSSFDKVMGKLDIIQTEITVGFSQINGRLNNHEKRIQVLESAQKAI